MNLPKRLPTSILKARDFLWAPGMGPYHLEGALNSGPLCFIILSQWLYKDSELGTHTAGHRIYFGMRNIPWFFRRSYPIYSRTAPNIAILPTMVSGRNPPCLGPENQNVGSLCVYAVYYSASRTMHYIKGSFCSCSLWAPKHASAKGAVYRHWPGLSRPKFELLLPQGRRVKTLLGHIHRLRSRAPSHLRLTSRNRGPKCWQSLRPPQYQGPAGGYCLASGC